MLPPLLTMPAAVLNAPPLIEYMPPLMVMVAVLLIPDKVTALDMIGVSGITPVWDVNEKGSGVVSLARVVTLKTPDTVPILSAALLTVEKNVDEVTFTETVLPFVTTPAVLTKGPLLME